MDSFQIFGLQVSLSLITYGVIAKWYVSPRLASLPLRDALIPLLFANCLRHVGMVMLVPAVADPNLPRVWTLQLAYGDLAAQLLALLSILALRARLPVALPLVWVFNIEGSVDLLFGFYQGARLDVVRYNLGSTWYIPTFIVPGELVIHYMIFVLLLKRRRANGF